MQLTQQIKIKPTISQEVVLESLSEKCRLIYNFALDERKRAYEKKHKYINYNKQQNDLPSIKQKYPEYKIVYSKVLQYTLRLLDADYKSFYKLRKIDETANPPKFKGKKYFTTMVYNQSGFKCYSGNIQLSHKHPSKIKLIFKIPDKFKFGKIYQISIYKKDNKDFYLSIVYEKAIQKYVDNGHYQAFDLGTSKHTGVNIKGKFIEFKNDRPDRYWNKKIEALQSIRDKCKKWSHRWKILNRSINWMKRKSSNQLKDFQHKLSKKMVDNTKANTIIFGDLKVKKIVKYNKKQVKEKIINKKHANHLNKSIHNTGNVSRFVSFSTYKAKLIGKRLLKHDESGTTITCCVCHNKQKMTTKQRVYICRDCGNKIDRDRNSAVLIMSKFLSQNALWTSYWEFLSNLWDEGICIHTIFSQEAMSLNCVTI